MPSKHLLPRLFTQLQRLLNPTFSFAMYESGNLLTRALPAMTLLPCCIWSTPVTAAYSPFDPFSQVRSSTPSTAGPSRVNGEVVHFCGPMFATQLGAFSRYVVRTL